SRPNESAPRKQNRRPMGVAPSQAAEKPFQAVIPSGARNLALSVFKTMRDSSSPAAPRNDRPNGFFRSLFSPYSGIRKDAEWACCLSPLTCLLVLKRLNDSSQLVH